MVSCQAPLSMEFSRQEYWSGLPFPAPGDLLDPGIEPGSLALQQILYCLSHQGSPLRKLLNPYFPIRDSEVRVGMVSWRAFNGTGPELLRFQVIET